MNLRDIQRATTPVRPAAASTATPYREGVGYGRGLMRCGGSPVLGVLVAVVVVLAVRAGG